MPDFHGQIQHVTIAETLWLIVIFPLVAALVCAWSAFASGRYSEKLRKVTAGVSIGATGLALAMSAYHAWVLAALPGDERFLLSHAWRMVRLGQLDANVDLALDPLASAMTLVVTGVGLVVVVRAAASIRRGESSASSARLFAWVNAFVFAMLVLVLADNFVLLFFGWEGVGLSSWGLLGFAWAEGAKAGAGQRAFLVNRVGDVALLLGIALFYWGFGGAWADGDYIPDLNARFSSLEEADAVTPAPADRDDEDEERAPAVPTKGGGFVTLTSYPGAAVFMDDARTPMKIAGGQVLRSPFVRVAVNSGFHSFRIHPGSGLDDFLVTHVGFGGGREIALVSFGPTVTFREARDQLAARDARGRATVRDSLVAKRGFGTVGLVTIACLLLLFGAASKVAPFPRKSAPAHAAIGALLGVYLIARLAFFFALSPAACVAAALVGAATLVFVAVGRVDSDSVYARALVALVRRARDFAAEFDRRVIDGVVQASAGLTQAFAWIVGRVDDDVVDGGVRALSSRTLRLGERIRAVQTGRVQTYVYGIVLGILALALLQYWLR